MAMSPPASPRPRRLVAGVVGLAIALSAGCATPQAGSSAARIEVAFAPEAGAESLVLKVINSAERSIRLAGYTFTSPAIVSGLIAAEKRGVDVKVLVDDRGNRGKSSVAAMNLIAAAEIPIRTVSRYAIHHDKYIVVDGRHTETGSFNFSQAAAKVNSENVIVVWNDTAIAARYLSHWNSRWNDAAAVEMTY